MAKKKRGGGTPHARLVDKDLPKRRARNTAIAAAIIVIIATVVVLRYRYVNLIGVPADTVTFETTKGTFVMKVYPTLVPETAANFEELCKSGFYNGLIFHRVEDWVVQSGDPKGDGTGGSDKTIKLEISKRLSNVRGAVGMARAEDPNSASSQFYILKQDARTLDGSYAVFARVVEGMKVVDNLEVGDKIVKVTYEKTSSTGGSK